MLKFSRILSFVSAIAFSAILSAQAPVQEVVPISAQVYNGLKAQGLLNPNAKYVFTDPIASGTLSPASHVNHSSRAQLSAPPCGYIPTTDFLDPWGGQVYFDDSPPAGAFEVQIPFDSQVASSIKFTSLPATSLQFPPHVKEHLSSPSRTKRRSP
jgi:hypothetical protein